METKIEPNETAIVTPVMLPACPYCADDPARLSIMNQIFPGGMIGAIIFCGNPECRKIISTQTVSAPAATSNQVQLSWTASVSCTTATPCTYIPYRIAGANLANLEVSVSENAQLSGATVIMTVYDIWTAGTYTGSTSHAHPWLLSELDEQIWHWYDGTVRNG